MVFTWMITFSILGSIGAIGGAAMLLLFPGEVRTTIVPGLISYATGTLLSAAFLGMIPHALEHAQVSSILGTVLAGVILFFLLEKLIIWHHCHDVECDIHGTAGTLILFGDAFHNLVDGIVIAAAFLTSIPLGVSTALAVVAHEVPQEVGDFGILLDSGYSRQKAFLCNLFSSITTLPGAVIAYLYLEKTKGAVPYVLAISAASFIYIALADLFPSLHRTIGLSATVKQLLLIMAGVGTILLFHHG
jgi:zinc and cadmium transporter